MSFQMAIGENNQKKTIILICLLAMIGRTSGDGMEEEQITAKVPEQQKAAANTARPSMHRKDSCMMQENMHARKISSTQQEENKKEPPLPGLHTLYRKPEVITRSLKPVVPKGELIALKPRLVTPQSTVPEHKKTKAPKFIPYEPYPGAVNPIVPYSSKNSSGRCTPHRQSAGNSSKTNKNNLDIGVLVSQMSNMRTQEMSVDDGVEGNDLPADTATMAELKALRLQAKTLQEEKDYFQGQFKFQTQVNAELKNLLVASVGEDLQTRVNVLTEDKFQLARALLDTANNLTTHTEQIEFLAGQCEVWRSKFLASSVMVEELARWKADLTQKNHLLTESTKQLLHATHQLREIQLESLKNLKFLAKIRYLNLPNIDVISLAAENLNILQQMVLHSGVGMPDGNLNIHSASQNPLCESEKYAVQALEFISQPLMTTDAAIRALFEQAHRPGGSTSMEPLLASSATDAAGSN